MTNLRVNCMQWTDYTSGVIRTTLIAWSEDDVDIIEYGNEFDKVYIIFVFSLVLNINFKSIRNLEFLHIRRFFLMVIVENGELKTELRKVFQGKEVHITQHCTINALFFYEVFYRFELMELWKVRRSGM